MLLSPSSVTVTHHPLSSFLTCQAFHLRPHLLALCSILVPSPHFESDLSAFRRYNPNQVQIRSRVTIATGRPESRPLPTTYSFPLPYLQRLRTVCSRYLVLFYSGLLLLLLPYFFLSFGRLLPLPCDIASSRWRSSSASLSLSNELSIPPRPRRPRHLPAPSHRLV